MHQPATRLPRQTWELSSDKWHWLCASAENADATHTTADSLPRTPHMTHIHSHPHSNNAHNTCPTTTNLYNTRKQQESTAATSGNTDAVVCLKAGTTQQQEHTRRGRVRWSADTPTPANTVCTRAAQAPSNNTSSINTHCVSNCVAQGGTHRRV